MRDGDSATEREDPVDVAHHSAFLAAECAAATSTGRHTTARRQELRADWKLQCVIRSACKRLPAQPPAASSSACDLWFLVAAGLVAERNMAWLPESLADRVHKFPGWAPAHPDTL